MATGAGSKRAQRPSGVAVRWLIAVRYAVDRLFQPRSRAEDVREVRLRLAEQAGPEEASPDEVQGALELRRLREELCSLFGEMQACRRCAAPPKGLSRSRSARAPVCAAERRSQDRSRVTARWASATPRRKAQPAAWEGGHCCSGPTRNLFTDEELAALRLSGTTPGLLRPPRGPHAGCAFRGLLGCSLDAADRPCLCVRYTCRELETELERRSLRSAVSKLKRELGTVFDRFVQARRARLEQEDLAELWIPPAGG